MPISNDHKKLLRFLSAEDCAEIRDYLTKRIWQLKHVRYPEKAIENLNLSARAYNALKAQKLDTIEDVLDFGLENIAMLRNAGPRTVQEVSEALDRFNRGG
jgi:DNA-directed RNA polymerase alpha subunit